MNIQIIKKPKTPFLLVLAALYAFSDTASANNINYSTKMFSADCRLFKGVLQIFKNSVTCKKNKNQSIICLRQGDAISGCKFENNLADQTTAKPQKPQPSTDFMNKAPR